MYCKICGGNDAYPGLDVNKGREILICKDCGEVTWPVPTVEELAEDVERIKERMKGISNMPFVEGEKE